MDFNKKTIERLATKRGISLNKKRMEFPVSGRNTPAQNNTIREAIGRRKTMRDNAPRNKVLGENPRGRNPGGGLATSEKLRTLAMIRNSSK